MVEPLTFGRWLKRLRAEQDLTQEMLAELANCAAPTLRSFEIGRRRPSRAMAERLAAVLQVPADQQAEFLRLARLPVEMQGEAVTDDVAAPLPGGAVKPNRLPPLPKPVTPFIGREAERNVLRQLIQHEHLRLITLLGAGGMGKTRLALAVAAELAVNYPDGAGFVTLAPLEDGLHLPAAIAHALNMPLLGTLDPGEQLLRALETRKMLLVLDNFEHLLTSPTALQWVTALLARAADVQTVITSRERLRIAGERIFALDGLTVLGPTPETKTDEQKIADALLLFRERAQAVAGDFVLTAANQAAITRICQWVEGMPLGIELAAAWVRVLNPTEIADEIARSMDFLAHADRDRNPRHQSMRAIFDHSWSLLEEEERTVLARLSLFRGGCRREAAAAVTGAALPLLATLIDKSLLRKSEGNDNTRYDMHEVIRQYAAERLQTNRVDDEQTRRLHGEFYCRWVAAQSDGIGDQRQRTTIDELQREIDNIRLAWDWAVQTRRGDLLYPMGRVIWIFCEIQNYYGEGEALFARAAAMAQALRSEPNAEQNDAAARKFRDILFGRMTTHQAYFVLRQVRPREAITLLAPALTVLRQHDDHHTLSQCLWTHGRASWVHGDFDTAAANFRAGLVIAEQLQFPNLLALYHTFLGISLGEVGEYANAYQHLQQALTFARQLREPRSTALAITYLHQTALQLGRGAEVALLLAEGVQIARVADDWYCRALLLEQQALAQLAQANAPQATDHFTESLTIFRKIGDMWSQSRLHTHLGHLALSENDLVTAETHFQQAVRLAYRVELKACLANGLTGLALLAARQGQLTRALTLALSVAQQPACSQSTRIRIEQLQGELAVQLSAAERATVQNHVQTTAAGQLLTELIGEL